MVKACWFCNKIKGSYLTYVEMKSIAKGTLARVRKAAILAADST